MSFLFFTSVSCFFGGIFYVDRGERGKHRKGVLVQACAAWRTLTFSVSARWCSSFFSGGVLSQGGVIDLRHCPSVLESAQHQKRVSLLLTYYVYLYIPGSGIIVFRRRKKYHRVFSYFFFMFPALRSLPAAFCSAPYRCPLLLFYFASCPPMRY